MRYTPYQYVSPSYFSNRCLIAKRFFDASWWWSAPRTFDDGSCASARLGRGMCMGWRAACSRDLVSEANVGDRAAAVGVAVRPCGLFAWRMRVSLCAMSSIEASSSPDDCILWKSSAERARSSRVMCSSTIKRCISRHFFTYITRRILSRCLNMITKMMITGMGIK